VRQHPRNPWIGLLIAALLLTIGVAGLLAVAINPAVLTASSNRRSGIILLGPLIALAFGAITLVRGFRAISPWMRHRSTPLAVRRQQKAADLHDQRVWPLWVAGLLALAGLSVLAVVFSLYSRDEIDLVGRLLQVEILGFLLLTAAGCLGLALQRHYYRRFYAAPIPA